ncbi:MAG: glycosyl transferase [Acidithiobacillales bacterium SM23_46]|jgi:glycosyltransferase involved in cell wall biosynthesis|nr:MAG: glycosyl transferase [Acidithiobacillales bacterium SM23_46]KPL27982.1 MAG: glycosyl transferase [Acidithiobacillales bacterium SM1_46]
MSQSSTQDSDVLSVILPAKNEANGLRQVLPLLRERYPHAEIIVVDDGSTDDTGAVAQGCGARVVKHPYSMGNGAAIKTGARAAHGSTLVFMDADNQHDPTDIEQLLEQLDNGYAMAIGARDGNSQANVGRWTANTIYNILASWMVGRRIPDLTSGFRAAHADKFREFLFLLPNGFSYPTTITMSFFRAGYPVAYIPIRAQRRVGRSHIRPLRDGIRFFLVIFKIGTLYSPLKMFLPISLAFFLTALGYYIFTFLTMGRFTNMSGLLFSTSVLIFLIGLVSEQITNLLYSRRDD